MTSVNPDLARDEMGLSCQKCTRSKGWCSCVAACGSADCTGAVVTGSRQVTYEQNEAALVTRRITTECDRYHSDPLDVGCENGSCQCWCHT